MSALLRQVTFNAAAFASATSTPVAASGTVRFRRAAGFVSGGQWVEPGHYDAAYAAGAFTAAVWLAVPDDAAEAARYTAKINGTSYPFSLSQGAAVDLATLILAGGVEDVDAVSQLLATKEDALGNPAADGYVLSSTDEGVRSWVEMSSGGGAPSGPAGGVLSGTYPNPDFAADMATQAELDAAVEALSTAIENSLTQQQADALYLSLTPAPAVYVGIGGGPAWAGTWGNHNDVTHEQLRFWVERGLVTVQGVIKNTAAVGGGTIFTLPNGYRPPRIVLRAISEIAAVFGTFPIRIDTNGDVVYLGGNGALSASVDFSFRII